MDKKYYEAYDLRYRQVHGQELAWFTSEPSPIVAQTLCRFDPGKVSKILEVGCGEGRDLFPLLDAGYDVVGIDVSPEAVHYCRRRAGEHHRDRFRVLDVCRENMGQTFDFIYSVATLHMLLEDEDRSAYFSFLFRHLRRGGQALILTMGDGEAEWRTRPQTAFDPAIRRHEGSGRELEVASTSCRIVSFSTFEREWTEGGFTLIEKGLTASGQDFPTIMYALLRK